MIKEAIEKLLEMHRPSEPRIRPTSDPQRETYWSDTECRWKDVDIPLPRVNVMVVDTIEGLADEVAAVHEKGEATDIEVYVCGSRVVADVKYPTSSDTVQPRDIYVWTPVPSKTDEAVEYLVDNSLWNQKDLVEYVELSLMDVVPSGWYERLCNLQIAGSSRSTHVVKGGKEAGMDEFAKEIIRETSIDGDLMLQYNLYQGCTEMHHVSHLRIRTDLSGTEPEINIGFPAQYLAEIAESDAVDMRALLGAKLEDKVTWHLRVHPGHLEKLINAAIE